MDTIQVRPVQHTYVLYTYTYVCTYSETSLIQHSMGPENNVGLGGCWIMECLLPYLSMVTVPHIMVGLERMLDYRGVRLERFHCTYIDGWINKYIHIADIHTTDLSSTLQTDTFTGDNPGFSRDILQAHTGIPQCYLQQDSNRWTLLDLTQR